MGGKAQALVLGVERGENLTSEHLERQGVYRTGAIDLANAGNCGVCHDGSACEVSGTL
jgi:hypothetical protein